MESFKSFLYLAEIFDVQSENSKKINIITDEILVSATEDLYSNISPEDNIENEALMAKEKIFKEALDENGGEFLLLKSEADDGEWYNYFLKLGKTVYVFEFAFTKFEAPYKELSKLNGMEFIFLFLGYFEYETLKFNQVHSMEEQGFKDSRIGMMVYYAIAFMINYMNNKKKFDFLKFAGYSAKKEKLYRVFSMALENRLGMIDVKREKNREFLRVNYPTIAKKIAPDDEDFYLMSNEYLQATEKAFKRGHEFR